MRVYVIILINETYKRGVCYRRPVGLNLARPNFIYNNLLQKNELHFGKVWPSKMSKVGYMAHQIFWGHAPGINASTHWIIHKQPFLFNQESTVVICVALVFD